MKCARNSFLKALSATLLLGYLLNVVSFESFHQIVHHNHDHAELHSAEAESDACHRAIYHGDTSHDCEHKSHITQFSDDCSLCDVILANYHDLAQVSSSTSDFLSVEYQSLDIDYLIKEFELFKQSRAPPVYS